MRKLLITKKRGGLWARLAALMVVLMMTTAQVNAQVAKIIETDVQYPSISAAINAATAGQTVRLLCSTSVGNQYVNKSITLDLGGFTVSGNYNCDALLISSGATVRFTNGTILASSNKSCCGVYDETNGGTLYVDHVNLTGFNAFYAIGGDTYFGEGVNCTTTSIYSSNGNGRLHITDGIYESSVLDCVAGTGVPSTDKLFLSGGCFKYNTFSTHSINEYLKLGYTTEPCTHGHTGYTDVVFNDSQLVAIVRHTEGGVVTETKFGKLADAVSAATSGEEVILIKDTQENVTVASGKDITLDLNGKVISATSGTVITNNGTLTLTDAVGGGNITGGAKGVMQNGTLTVGGKLNITGNTANLYLPANKTVSVSALTTGANIGVTTATAPTASTPVQITAKSDNDYSAHFTSDNANYNVENISNKVFLTSNNTEIAQDPTSTYTPTNIINGGFDKAPWMNYYYDSELYDGVNKYWINSYYVINAQSTVKNGVDKGWNSSTLRVQCGILFDYQNNLLPEGVFTELGTGRHIYNWSPTEMNDQMSKETLDARGGFIECNGDEAATLYQDLTTFGGDVIRWSYLHGVRYDYWASDVQPMTVYVGAPNGTPTNTDPAIVAATLGKYYSNTGNDGHAEGEGRAYGNVDELKYLRLNKTDHATKFYTTAGIYVVPEGQTVTRFAFQSNAESPQGGNWMDDVTFSTLIGNLHASIDDYGNVIITGYWGDTNTDKKLCVKVGEEINRIDMSSVLNKNFKITFPKDKIGSATQVEIYHEDYEQAKRTVKIDPYKQVNNFDPKFKGGLQYISGINPNLGTAVFTDNGQTVNGSSRAVTKGKPITFKVPNGYKYYDGTTYDMYFKITSNIDMASPAWKFTKDNDILTLAFDYDIDKDFEMEMWLQSGSAVVDNMDVVGGSCRVGTGEGVRPYSDDGYIYTNIDNPESVWAWNADKSAWISNNTSVTYEPEKYIFGHGMSADHTLKGGYYGGSGCVGEFVFGYMTKNVTFRAEFADGSAATDVTFSYPNPAMFSNNVLKVPVDKAIGTLPTVNPSTVTHWYVGNDKTTTYTAEQISALTVTADMTVTAVMPAACVNTTTNKQYATVQSAVNEAESNETLKMLANSTEDVTISEKAITLDLNGNNLEKKSGTNAITVSNGSLTIKDDTETAGGVNGGISNTGGSTVKIEGGKYSFDPTPFLDVEHAAQPIGETPYIYEVVSGDNIACIANGHGFFTLQQAIDFQTTPATEPMEITLSKDIEENIEIATGKDIILDLKGKTITSKSGGTVITNNGTLTVIDSSEAKTGTITGATEGAGIDNEGTLNLYAGNVTGNATGVDDNSTLTVGGTTKITLNGPVEARKDLYLPNEKIFSIATGTYAPTTMNIGITTQTAPLSGTDITLTGENGKDYSQHFFGDDSKYSVINTEGNVLKLTNEVKVLISADPMDGGEVKLYKAGTTEEIEDPEHILYGTAVTITATPSGDYAFAGWYDKDSGLLFSRKPTFTFDAIRDYNLEARFTDQVIWVRIRKGN